MPNIKLEALLITVLKRSRDFSNPINICRVKFRCYRPKCVFEAFLEVLLVLPPMIHDTCIFINIKLEQLQIIILKRSCDLSKTIEFFKDIFTSVVQNSSSEWFMGFTAYDTR